MKTFEDLGLGKETLEIIGKKGYKTPSSIQEQTIPLLLNKVTDIIGQSQTGTGKTAAFGLPIIENILKNSNSFEKSIKALILCPTRELAIQVGSELKSFVGDRKLNVFTIYGGQSYIIEKRHIKNGIDILVGTPGRIIDHIQNLNLDFSNIQYFVLDEADEMLNMGFIDDIESILDKCPKTKTTLFFSATMPKEIINTAKKYMNDFKIITVKSNTLTNKNVKQFFYVVKQTDKLELLCRIMDMEYDFYGIIFCKTKSDVDELTTTLNHKGYNVESIHGDISQSQREKIFNKFKTGNTKILIATDVAARGLDVSGLSHVINYAIPQSAEDYTHRIGRTGRAGKDGVAITFVTPFELKKIGFIKNVTRSDILQKQIPTIDDVLKAQTENIKKMVGEGIDNNSFEEYMELAHEIHKLDKAEKIIATLLSLLIKKRFSKDKYGDIDTQSYKKSFYTKSDNNSGKSTYNKDQVRMYVNKGKNHGINHRKLIDFISKQSGISPRFINDLEIMNDFSFFNCSKNIGEKLVKHFSNPRYWGKMLIKFANTKK